MSIEWNLQHSFSSIPLFFPSRREDNLFYRRRSYNKSVESHEEKPEQKIKTLWNTHHHWVICKLYWATYSIWRARVTLSKSSGFEKSSADFPPTHVIMVLQQEYVVRLMIDLEISKGWWSLIPSCIRRSHNLIHRFSFKLTKSWPTVLDPPWCTAD